MIYSFSLIITLLVFWLIASGIMHSFLLFCGAISVIATFCTYIFFIRISEVELNEDLHIYKKMPNIFTILSFCFKILIDICKSSFSLIKNIICEKTINTQIIELDMNHAKHDFHIMILAHSITMTPGSITIFQNEKKIIVHCLYKETATEISK